MAARPGQFFNIAFPDGAPYLPRPFSVYEMYQDTREMDFLMATVGVGTLKFENCKAGDVLRMVGPLGNGFTLLPDRPQHVYVAGSIGLAPFIELFQELVKLEPKARHTLVYGCRKTSELVDVDFLESLNWDVHLCTDDGSRGRKGFVTDVLSDLDIDPGAAVYSCGPTPMMEAVHRQCVERKLDCWVSMEEHMACGIGICKGCVIHKEGTPPPLATVCKTGPVFSSREVFSNRDSRETVNQ